MTLMLVKVKCQLPKTALVVVFAYLLVFVPKVIYDSMRVAYGGVDEKTDDILDMISIGCERIKDVVV